MFEIVAREDFSDVTYLLEVSYPALAKAARPGQFVLVIAHEHAEHLAHLLEVAPHCPVLWSCQAVPAC